MDGENGNNAYLSEDNPNYPFLKENGTLPVGIAIAATFSSKKMFNLAELNDNDFSFKQISRVIKEIWTETSI
jgi:hypothetical protein